MSQIRPSRMPQGEFAELLRENGFPACSKAAVSLAERPKETGVQFTPEARETAQRLLNSPRRPEKRANPNKTTVWFDDETRAWLETRAYMEDTSIGEVVRRIVYTEIVRCKAREVRGADPSTSLRSAQDDNEEKAASDVATIQGGKGRATGILTLNRLHDTTKQEENQA